MSCTNYPKWPKLGNRLNGPGKRWGSATMSLYDEAGRRLYLNAGERAAFRDATSEFSPEVKTFALTLLETGCRISEALALTPERVDRSSGTIVFESLKRRRAGVYRAVPVPEALLQDLEAVHDFASPKTKLWQWSRKTAYTRVKDVMSKAGVTGACASPKGLR